MRTAADVADLPVEEALVIGDGLGTDILAAHAVGARSVLMLTGVSTSEMALSLPSDQRPTFIARDAAELEPLLVRLSQGAR